MFVHRVLWLLLAACSFTAPAPPSDAPGTDPVTIEFAMEMSGADERSDVITVSVVLSAPSDAPVTVSYAVVGGSAEVGSDFMVAPGSTLTFAAGQVQQDVAITVVADADETEPDETIDLVLSAPSGATLGAQTTHTITISNLVLPRVELAAATTTTSEGSQTVVTVTLDTAAQGASTVVLEISGGQATPGDDFAIAGGTVITIAPGALTATVPIGEVDDLLDEENETVIFALTNPSSNILIGAVASSTHTIIDDDEAPVVRFAAATSSVAEAAGTSSIDVTLSAASGRTVTVGFSRDVNDSSVANDATVNGAPGTLTFAPGEVSKTITLTITNDARSEVPETVIVNLANPSNATLGTAEHTATIIDDDADPTVSFQGSQSNAPENAFFTFTVVTVNLSRDSGKPITVPFTRTGTASLGSDYGTNSSPLTFAPGETSKTIVIDWTNDTREEANETVILTIENPINAAVGDPPAHTFTIIDDDE